MVTIVNFDQWSLFYPITYKKEVPGSLRNQSIRKTKTKMAHITH